MDDQTKEAAYEQARQAAVKARIEYRAAAMAAAEAHNQMEKAIAAYAEAASTSAAKLAEAEAANAAEAEAATETYSEEITCSVCKAALTEEEKEWAKSTPGDQKCEGCIQAYVDEIEERMAASQFDSWHRYNA